MIKWTKERIAEKILEAKAGLGIDYMPTRKQLDAFFGDTCLSNKVGKTLGYYGWAEHLGIPVQENDTRKGKLAEQWAAEYLQTRGYSVKQMLQNYPYDLLVNGCVKVDVKFSNLYIAPSNACFYSFALRKQPPTCDVYLLIAQDREGERTVYILPSAAVSQQQISMGEHHSAYHKYKDAVVYLDKLSAAFSEAM